MSDWSRLYRVLLVPLPLEKGEEKRERFMMSLIEVELSDVLCVKRKREKECGFFYCFTSSLSVESACCVRPDTLRTSAVFRKLLSDL